jgi:DNA transposition AAA+ family ATPase
MTNHLPDAVCDKLRGEVKALLESRPDLTSLDLAGYTTLSDSAVKSFINGQIRGGRDVVGEVRRVLELARAGDILRPGGPGDSLVLSERPSRVVRVVKAKKLYSTQTVARVAEVLDFCAENCTIGVITAGFGCGKTEAVAAWRCKGGRYIETLVYEFDEFSSHNKVDFIGGLASEFGLEHAGGSAGGARTFRAVCKYLNENPCLLVFDQCETLRVNVFQVIRQLWDRTHEAGVGVVLLAAPILLQRMNGSKLADLGALTSRVGVWAPLTGVSKQEMAAIVKQEGITDVEEAAFDLWWKATGGSMRRLMRAIDLLKAKHQGKRINERTITGIAGHLWGLQVAA